ncbi:hypothetical protein LXL04_034444 [Taraxacum kok-saghyz]
MGEMLPFLSSSVPNLSFDDLAINIQASCSELNTDGGLGFEAKLIPSESRKLQQSKWLEQEVVEGQIMVAKTNTNSLLM